MGKFISKAVNSYETYIIAYLNSLIHGILRAGQELFDSDLRMYGNWPHPPHLLTFFLGDLIRCKYSSQEK